MPHPRTSFFKQACSNSLFLMPLEAHACIPERCFVFKDACSNTFCFMPLGASAWHPWNLSFKGGLQQFLMFRVFEGLCMASLKLVFKGRPAAIPYVLCLWRLMHGIPQPCLFKDACNNSLCFHVFEGFCMASLKLVFNRRPAAIPYVSCLWELLHGIPRACF